jgi:osmotically-inducible protein OsmY
MKLKLKKITILLLTWMVVVSTISVHAQGNPTSDVWLESKISTTYALNEHLSVFDITVDVKNGVALLGGNVDSSVEKSLAFEIAKGIDGIKSVKNNIKVAPVARKENSSDFMTTVGNASMVARVKSNLLWNQETSGMDINVDADGGTVTLSGTVSSEIEKQLAVQLAGNTSGVYHVVDKLLVGKKKDTTLGEKIDQKVAKTEKVVSDTWITARVKSRLLFDKETDGMDIKVTTKNAVVTLEGSVLSKLEKEYAIKLTENTVNVKKVIDRLSIKQ